MQGLCWIGSLPLPKTSATEAGLRWHSGCRLVVRYAPHIQLRLFGKNELFRLFPLVRSFHSLSMRMSGWAMRKRPRRGGGVLEDAGTSSNGIKQWHGSDLRTRKYRRQGKITENRGRKNVVLLN
jgi:hypothetical protein